MDSIKNLLKKKLTLLSLVPFALILGFWAFIPLTRWSNPFILPDISTVFDYFGSSLNSKTFWLDIKSSQARVSMAFALSMVIAIPLGLLASFSQKISYLIEPFSEFVRYLPVPALVPLFMMWFGLNVSFMIVTIFIGTVFQLILMVSDIGRGLDKEYYAAAKTLGASQWHLFTRILWPASLPQIVNACRIAIGWAWTYLIVAEIVGNGAEASGLGFRMLEAMRTVETHKMFSGIIVIGVIGIITDQTIRLAYKYAFRWVS